MGKAALPWILIAISALFSVFHYRNVFPGNDISWISWILALALYFLFLKPAKEPKFWTKEIRLLVLFVTLLYFLTHLWNYSLAPWNNFGLFDDAAWDIYFAKNHVFNHTPYQAAFFDQVGNISRETLFHYYISTAFKLFGYNLGAFNGSLIFLGFFTVLFTTLLAQEFFASLFISALVAIITNFLPIISLNVFVGHRYAMALPLMMASYYFLYSGFRISSHRRIFVAGLLAGLCLESSVMGKQYIFALLGTGALWLIANRKGPLKNKTLVWIFVSSLIMAAEPLIIYIYFAGAMYSIRESSLIHIFIDNFKTSGVAGISSNLQTFRDVFFAPFTYTRRFLPDFFAIPFAYYPLLVVGSFISIIKKRYEIVLISLVTLAGSFVAGSGDYRVLLATGVWVLAIGFALNETLKIGIKKGNPLKRVLATLLFLSFLFGLVPSVVYLFKLSSDTNHIFYFLHKDVALSRFVQDIVAQDPNPSVAMKKDEFARHAVPGHSVATQVAFFSGNQTDYFFCPQSAYAIIHLYLQNFDDNKILSFCDGAPYDLFEANVILRMNVTAIEKVRIENKDLRLMWEVSGKVEPILRIFRPFSVYGQSEIVSGEISGVKFNIFSLLIKKENIRAFQIELARRQYNISK